MDLLVSYGSLISRESREKFSKIYQPVDLVKLRGWKRYWGAPYPDEGATYAAAAPNINSHLHGVLVPIEMSDDLRHRERGYDFVEIKDPANELDLLTRNTEVDLSDSTVWIAQAKVIATSNNKCPLPQSYVDTCLLGCLEIGTAELVDQFVRETEGWEGVWINDRNREPSIFPRAAKIKEEFVEIFDNIIKEFGVIEYRKE